MTNAADEAQVIKPVRALFVGHSSSGKTGALLSLVEAWLRHRPPRHG